jgi:hypothetical protein
MGGKVQIFLVRPLTDDHGTRICQRLEKKRDLPCRSKRHITQANTFRRLAGGAGGSLVPSSITVLIRCTVQYVKELGVVDQARHLF